MVRPILGCSGRAWDVEGVTGGVGKARRAQRARPPSLRPCILCVALRAVGRADRSVPAGRRPRDVACRGVAVVVSPESARPGDTIDKTRPRPVNATFGPRSSSSPDRRRPERPIIDPIESAMPTTGSRPMNAIATKTTYTPEDLLAMPDEKDYELVDGQLVERNMSTLSSWVAGDLYFLIRTYCETHPHRAGLSEPTTATSASPTPRTRSASPTSRSSVASGCPRRLADEGYLRRSPPTSPSRSSRRTTWPSEVDEKVDEYLGAGVPLVWVVNPEVRVVRVHRADFTSAYLTERRRAVGRGRPARLPLPRRGALPAARPRSPPKSRDGLTVDDRGTGRNGPEDEEVADVRDRRIHRRSRGEPDPGRRAAPAGVSRLRQRGGRHPRRRPAWSSARRPGGSGSWRSRSDASRRRATCGISHTRWATHGPASDRNAHPHLGGHARRGRRRPQRRDREPRRPAPRAGGRGLRTSSARPTPRSSPT